MFRNIMTLFSTSRHPYPFSLTYTFVITTQMLDVKDGGRGVFVCSSPGPDPYTSQDLYNPVYEELSNGKCR